jgi:predicted RNA-binding protein
MCQATVYLTQNGQEREVMRDVILLEPVEEGVRLQAFFEEPLILRARIGRIDFMKHTVTLVSAEGGQDGNDGPPPRKRHSAG